MSVINITPLNATIFCNLLKKNTCICLYHWKDCGHCVELLPIWRMAAEKAGKNANIAEIELENMKYLDKKYTNVMGFPTIIVYKNGAKKAEFKDQRTLQNLEKFIKDNSDIKPKKTNGVKPKKTNEVKPKNIKETKPKIKK